MSILSKRVAALAASLPPPPSQFDVADYRRGDEGFDAALAGIVERNRGKPGGITDQDEVFSISVIKGLPGQGEISRLSAPWSIRSLSEGNDRAFTRLAWSGPGSSSDGRDDDGGRD